MSAAVSRAPAPLLREGSEFWNELTEECKRQVETINSIVSHNGLSGDLCIRCTTGPELRMSKLGCPSTLVSVRIGFFSWGPMLSLAITGRRNDDAEFLPAECEMPIARDGDGSVIAIFEEGRSFSPRELASYLTQSFRRCYPGLPLH